MDANATAAVSLRVQGARPFHDGWNVACFVVLLLFVLAVLSLAALAVLYELLDCGCCAEGKTRRQLVEEEEEEEEGEGGGQGNFHRLTGSPSGGALAQTEVV